MLTLKFINVILRRLIPVLLVTTFFNICFAQGSDTYQGYVLSGQVYDSVSHEPVIGANIILLEDGKIVAGVHTGEDGSFQMGHLEAGDHIFLVQSMGYRSEKFNRNITSSNNPVSISLAPSSINMVPVEIIGNTSASLRDLTGTATKIDEKTLKLIKPIGTQEILQYVPGVVASPDDGMGNSRVSIGIRGLNPRRSSRVLILEDGVPIQPALYVYPNMYYNPPVERIDRIEVIKGSSSIKYGPQTMGGVINYITKRPSGIPGGKVELIGGNNNYLSAFAVVDGFGTSKVSPQLQLLYKTADGFRENNHLDQFNATLKLNIVPKSDRSIYVKLNANKENTDATYTGLTEYSFRNDANFNPKKYDNFDVLRLSADIIFHRNHNDELSSNTTFYSSYFDRNWWRENDIYVDAATYDGSHDPAAVPYYYKNYNADLIRVGNGKNNFGNLRTFYTSGLEHEYTYLHKIFGASASLEAGGRVHWERFVDRKAIGNAPDAREGVYFYEDSTGKPVVVGTHASYETTAFAFFMSESLQIGRLKVDPGVRVETFEQENINHLAGNIYSDHIETVILPGLGLNLEAGKYNIFAGIHKGYTPPSSSTLNILHFGANTAGIDLKAEKSWNTELGLRRSSNAFSFESALFYLQMTDLVAPAKGARFKNLGAAYSAGIENTLLVRSSEFIKSINWLPNLHLSYTYLTTAVIEGEIDAFETTGTVNIAGNELPYAPDHSLTVGVSKEFFRKLSLRADYQYISRQFTDYENLEYTLNGGYLGPIPAYYLLHGSASFMLNKHFSFSLAGKNLLDEIYIGSRLHSYPTDQEAFISSGIIPGPRRQINLGIKYSF